MSEQPRDEHHEDETNEHHDLGEQNNRFDSTAQSENGPTQIATNEPVVDRDAGLHPLRQRQPASAITTDVYESTATGPASLHQTPSPVTFQSTPPPIDADDQHRELGQDSTHSHDRPENPDSSKHKTKKSDRDQATNWRTLIGALMVGLFLGFGGAWGYGHFFGANRGQGDSNSSSSKQEQSGGGSSSNGGNGGSSNKSGGSGASDITGFGSPDEARNLHSKLQEVSERIDRLKMRVDRLKPDNQASPPGLSTLQIRVGELSREVDDVS